MTPATLSAATVSPPPAKLTSFFASVSSATASATSTVPVSNGSTSKAPNGPFQTRVLERASTEMTCSMLRGPMSKIMSVEPTSSTATTRVGTFAASFCATTTSTGSTISRLSALALARMSRGVVDQIVLAQRLADRLALRGEKVLAMPPPMISVSTFDNKCPSRSSLVEIFAPPTIATTGCCGVSKRLLQRIELGLHGAAGIGGEVRHRHDRGIGGVLAVRHGKGVVDEQIAERCEFFGER